MGVKEINRQLCFIRNCSKQLENDNKETVSGAHSQMENEESISSDELSLFNYGKEYKQPGDGSLSQKENKGKTTNALKNRTARLPTN